MNTTIILAMASVILIQNVILALLFFKYLKALQWKDLETTPFYVFKGKAYWKKNGKICRSDFVNGKLDPATAEYVDPMGTPDVSPVDLIEILNIIEESQK